MSPEQWMASQAKTPMSPEEWLAMQPTQKQPEQRSQLAALAGSVGQGVGNVALGAQNLLGMGLEKLGAESAGQWLQQDATQGKAKLAGEIAPYAEQYPMTTAGGKLAGEIAATLPVGGVLAKGASMVPGVAKSAPIIQALRSGGATGGNLAARSAAGATVGYAAGGLANPDEAQTGATIGGALPFVGAALRQAGPITSKILGATTGAGEEPIKQAFMAGKTGGAQAKALRENMRGQADMLNVLDDAKANLAQLQAQRSAQYQASTQGMRSNSNIVDLSPIAQSVDNVANDFMFKGQAKNPQAAKAIQDARTMVAQWAQLDPVQYHTPAGLDALKQQIGALREGIPFEQRSARAAIDRVYKSVGDQVKAADPQYAEAMADYAKASDLIDEAQKALSLNEKASADTAMRKLQSLMRNNANTNYGARLQTAQALESQGGRQIMPALAGQALNEWTPRGIQRGAAAVTGGGLALTGNIPAAIGMAALGSPRLAGESAMLAGQASRVVNPAIVEALRRGTYSSAPIIGVQ